MDQLRKYIFPIYLLLFCFCISFFACNRKTGCPGEDAQVKVNKKGNPTSKSKSGLFDKKTTKKMGGKS